MYEKSDSGLSTIPSQAWEGIIFASYLPARGMTYGTCCKMTQRSVIFSAEGKGCYLRLPAIEITIGQSMESNGYMR